MIINLKNSVRVAKRTRLGRMFCRFCGDQTGAVLMEYVILGVLVAAAATLAVIYFGKGIVYGFNTMNTATTGQTKAAESTATANQASAVEAKTESEKSRVTISGGAGNNTANPNQ